MAHTMSCKRLESGLGQGALQVNWWMPQSEEEGWKLDARYHGAGLSTSWMPGITELV